MSSAEPEPGEPPDPAAEDITDPDLAAEVDNPGDANAPTGGAATPGSGATAADDGPIAAPGAPGELSSDQSPSQGGETGETAPGESVGEVAGGDAGSPESATGADAAPADAAAATAGDVEAAVAPDQPPSTPSAEVAAGAAVQRATEEKVAQAVAAREAAVSAAEPEADPGEVDEARQGMVDTLRRVLGDGVVEVHVVPGVDAWVRVAIGDWRTTAEVCRDELGLSYFCYLSAVDWLPSPYGRSEEPPSADADDVEGGEAASGDTGAEPGAVSVTSLEHGVAGGETRFQLLARLVSPASHLGVTLKADLSDEAPMAPSLIEVYPGADWHEREAWEMYGIDFSGHPNLIHLYLPGGFEGHPLRKDFPLLAREVKPWPGLVDVEAMPGEGDGA